MTNNELKLLQSAMDHSKSYLEFGSGNSTYMAVATDNIKKITVVESDVTFWETHLMSTPAIYEAVEKGRLHPYLVNIGVTGKWGYPMVAAALMLKPLLSPDPCSFLSFFRPDAT